MHAAALGAAWGPGKLECTKCEDTARTRGIVGEGKPQRPCADDTRMWPEPARSTQQMPVPIEFVSVLHLRRSEDVPRRLPGRHVDHAPVPGIAGVAGMSMRHPPADVVRQADVAVMAARLGGEGYGFPGAVVRADVGPA